MTENKNKGKRKKDAAEEDYLKEGGVRRNTKIRNYLY